MMTPRVLAFAAALAALPASARAQAPADTARRAPSPAAVPVDSAVRDLERAVSALAATVQGIVTQTANNPEVRLAAVRVAGQAVGLARDAVTQNTGEIERLLAEASRVLAAAEAQQKAKLPKP